MHVGLAVSDENIDSKFTTTILPASHESGYSQRYLDGKSYVVEYYDERFHGDEEGFIVEIWVPGC